MPTIELDNFESTFHELSSNKTKCVMIFSGPIDETGGCWCSDCQQMAPYYKFIEEAATKAGLVTYKFYVGGDSQIWKDPQHVIRKNQILKVTNIPTVGLFNGSQLINRLVEYEISNEVQRDELYSTFTK